MAMAAGAGAERLAAEEEARKKAEEETARIATEAAEQATRRMLESLGSTTPGTGMLAARMSSPVREATPQPSPFDGRRLQQSPLNATLSDLGGAQVGDPF